MNTVTSRVEWCKVAAFAVASASASMAVAVSTPMSAASDGVNLMSATSVMTIESPKPLVSQYRTTGESEGRNLLSTKKGILVSFR